MLLRRPTLYPIALAILLGGWLFGITISGKWGVFGEHWSMSVTMLFGSFVAGSTPAGGGSVAFPVFTKVLGVSPAEARTFSLMIQSVGMTMASLFIFSRRIRVYRAILVTAIPAGIVGHALGTVLVSLPYPYPRLLFTMVAAVFGVSLFLSHWVLRWHPVGIDDHFEFPGFSSRIHLAVLAALGGAVASTTGSGVDMLCFVSMIFCFGLHEKRAIPTSVVTMAAISCFGFALRGTTGRIEAPVWDYWLACVPIVAVGAPLGAWVAARLGRDALMSGLLVLIFADLVSTILLIPLGLAEIEFMLISALAAGLYLGALLRRRASRRRRQGFAETDAGRL